MFKTLCILGTRPEAIKMAPLICQLNASSELCNEVCTTGQHREMLKDCLNLFSINADYELDVMQPNQTLSELSYHLLKGVTQVLLTAKPDLVLVHGDTSTTFIAALAAFYQKIPVAHIEAGLRTGDLYAPWPEEANRKLTAHLATLHFAPTLGARDNLLKEGIDAQQIHVTGNTVIDALYQMVHKLEHSKETLQSLTHQFGMLSPARKYILVTGHRRESFGEGFERICSAIAQLAKRFPEVDIVYPVHFNPNVRSPVTQYLSGVANIHLMEPVNYLAFVYLMKHAYLIVTDSGGVQEEAPALGKPVLVMRDITERPEALEAGTAVLVGTDTTRIIETVAQLLEDEAYYQHLSWTHQAYGDGEASQRILEKIIHYAKAAVPEESKDVV